MRGNVERMGISLLVLSLHILWVWLFVSGLDLGLIGLGLATDVTYLLGVIFAVTFIHYGNFSKCWGGKIL